MAEHGFGRQVDKRRHLLGIAGLDPGRIRAALDLAETHISLERAAERERRPRERIRAASDVRLVLVHRARGEARRASAVPGTAT